MRLDQEILTELTEGLTAKRAPEVVIIPSGERNELSANQAVSLAKHYMSFENAKEFNPDKEKLLSNRRRRANLKANFNRACGRLAMAPETVTSRITGDDVKRVRKAVAKNLKDKGYTLKEIGSVMNRSIATITWYLDEHFKVEVIS
jgi:hypothetical protein